MIASTSPLANSQRCSRRCQRRSRHAVFLYVYCVKATPQGFAPSKPLFKPQSRALHCTGTVAGGMTGE